MNTKGSACGVHGFGSGGGGGGDASVEYSCAHSLFLHS